MNLDQIQIGITMMYVYQISIVYYYRDEMIILSAVYESY